VLLDVRVLLPAKSTWDLKVRCRISCRAQQVQWLLLLLSEWQTAYLNSMGARNNHANYFVSLALVVSQHDLVWH
jgi:hypothetical protein